MGTQQWPMRTAAVGMAQQQMWTAAASRDLSGLGRFPASGMATWLCGKEGMGRVVVYAPNIPAASQGTALGKRWLPIAPWDQFTENSPPGEYAHI